MYKKADLSFSVAAQSYGNDVTDIQFSTQDKNTAKLVFIIKEKKEPLNLADIDGEITLVMQDKSRFTGKAEVTEPLNGVIEYTVTSEQIRHAGRVQGDLTLKHKNGSSLGGFRFNFTIKKALIDEDLGPVKEFYIQDLEEVKQEVQKKADAVALDIDKFKGDIDSRTKTIENKVNSFESNIGQSTVVQVQTAKGEYADLDARIKSDIGKVTTQLAETAKKSEVQSLVSNKADKTYVDQVTQSIASGSPKGTYSTLSALQSAFPTGNTNIYVVTSDGNWYYWNGNAWVSGGLYQTTIVKDSVSVASKLTGGNFENATNWNPAASGTITASNNELTYTVTALASTSRIQHTSFLPVIGHKYYIRGDILAKFSNTTYIQIGDSLSIAKNPNANEWSKISGIIIATSTITPSFKFYHATNTNYVVGDTIKFKKLMVIDLTELYGAGNEPSVIDFETTLEKFQDSWIGTTPVQIAPPQYLTQALDSKVEKVEGKRLSTNDYTDADKKAVASLNPRKIITVKKDGTGDFTNIRSALASITNANETNQYEVQIHEGVYDIFADYSAQEIEDANFIGLRIENYIHLKGIGNRGKVHLKGELADTFSTATQSRVSTIATINNGDLENLLITAKNLRYAVHDDYNYPGYKRNVFDCDFVKYTGGGYVQAYGEGCWSDTKTVFKNCTFHTDTTGMPYSCHNNRNFSKPSYHRLEGCTFTNKAGLTAIRFGSMGSGQKDVVELINCKTSGQILLSEEVANSGVGIDFDIRGYGNDIVPVEIKHTKAGQQVVYDLLGETKKLYNSDANAIAKGTLVKYNSYGSGIAPLLPSDPFVRFIGIAMHDIPAGELGFVRIGGYLPINETNLTGLSLGKKVGIVNGALAEVTSADYIGYVEVNNYIKLV